MPRKPRIFIASSRESISIAYAIQENLQDDAEVTVWDQNSFQLSSYALESLTKQLPDYHFAICVCTPTDRAVIRDQEVDVTRDNVIFELGLFIGRYGRERCFVVQPNGAALHLPSDFMGIMTGRYDPNRSDKNLRAALGPACNQIREQIKAQFSDEENNNNNNKVRNIAVICYRNPGVDVELLLTRTSGGRWIIPKGRRAKPQTVAEAVQSIGLTEAGAVGRVDPETVGSFRYLKSDNNQEQTLAAFLLEVERLEAVAQSFRNPTWFPIGKAGDVLAENRGPVYAQEFRVLIENVRVRIGGLQARSGR